jgi:uncharacterized repeat protein (TIGR02543 family)
MGGIFMREKISKRFFGKLLITFLVLAGIFLIPPKSVSNAAADNAQTEYQKALDLRKQGKFKISNPSIIMQMDEKANGVMIIGDAADFSGTMFTYGDDFRFDDRQTEYFLIDALAQRKKNVKLAFYLDDEKKPFATVSLAKQKKAEIWSTVKSRCVNLSGKKISGKHKLRFQVVTQDTGILRLVIRSLSVITSDLPVVEFNLDESQGSVSEMNGDMEHDTECYGTVSLSIPKGYKPEYTDSACKSGKYTLDYVRGRGNSTWNAAKKPYKFKLETKQGLLGMGANKHWILLANYYDVSMLRNKLTYWLGAELGMEFTPKCEFVNVIMNGEYLGSYYLSEQVRVGKSRVNIDDLEDDEETKASIDESVISGGYLLGLSPYGDELKKVFSTSRDNRFLIESPSFEDYENEAQYNYIKDYVQKTEDAIYGNDFQDDGKSYQEYMDIDSAVDYYWIQEISKNGDAFASTSTYLYKKRNGKLYWGPLWDFDYVAWGATEYHNNYYEGYSQNTSMWFGRLFEDPVFYQKIVDRWPAIKEKLLEAAKDGGQIDIYSKKQYESQKTNYQIWEKYSDRYGHEWYYTNGKNEGESVSNQITYDSEVERLKLWVKQRVGWIDENLNDLKRTYYTVKFMVDETEYISEQIGENDTIGIFPAVPEKEGYQFDGWYATKETEAGSYKYQLTENIKITEDITVKAKWKERSTVLPIQKIGFYQKEYYMTLDDNLGLNYCVLPFEADDTELIWSSSDETIASVMNGMVLSKMKVGDVVITATAPNGVSASCLVHLIDYKNYETLQSAMLLENNIVVSKGGYGRIAVQHIPENAIIYSELNFASSDEEIVQVNGSGYVHGLKEGTAIVVVHGGMVKPLFCKVTVVDDGKADIFPVMPNVPRPDISPAPDTTPVPDVSPVPDETPIPDVTPPSDTPAPDINPTPTPVPDIPIKIEPKKEVPSASNHKGTVKKGTKFVVNGLRFKVLSIGGKKTVSCIGAQNLGKKLTIPAGVTYKKQTFKVISIGKNAFAGSKTLVKATIGQNITEIGDKAFANCKKLKEVSIKSSTLKKAGKNIFAGISSKPKLKAPKDKKLEFQKILKL